jgi:hypothetical protein
VPRIRSIKPERCYDPLYAGVSWGAQVFLDRLGTQTDDYGCMQYIPRQMAVQLFGHDDVEASQIREWVAECENRPTPLVQRWTDGNEWIFLTRWFAEQYVSEPGRRRTPPPPALVPPGDLTTLSGASAEPERSPLIGSRILDTGYRDLDTGKENCKSNSPEGVSADSAKTPRGKGAGSAENSSVETEGIEVHRSAVRDAMKVFSAEQAAWPDKDDESGFLAQFADDHPDLAMTLGLVKPPGGDDE